MPSERAHITPEVLRWARENVGYTEEEAAKKAQISVERYRSWEEGKGRPTMRQARMIARAFKRPLGVFYLPEPPLTFQPLRDFRRLPGQVAGTSTPELNLEIRAAHERRLVALQLLEEIGNEPPLFTAEIDPGTNPEDAARFIRDLLGITYEDQLGWRSEYDPYNAWRSAIENAGILVFQASGIGRDVMRGFSVSDFPLPVIVVNTKDTPRGRVFSLLHELTHILLRAGGLCDFDENAPRPPEEDRYEIFCNRVAGAVLVPEERLLLEPEVVQHTEGPYWDENDIRRLARRYGVSKEVVLRRLLILGRTTTFFYEQKRAEYQEEYARRQDEQQGFALPDVRAVASLGRYYTGLVLTGYHNEAITRNDVSELLGVRLKHMSKIESSVFGQPLRF